jgi:hypothetical protein
MFIGLFAAEKGFVSFDNSLQFGEFAAASLTKAVKHEPRRFLLYTNLFGDLHGANALAGGDEQVHSIEPLMQRDVAALEDRAGTDGEVKLAFVAAMKASLAGRDAILTGTGWAGDTFRPETALKIGSSRLFVGKYLEELKSTDSRTAHDLFPFLSGRKGPIKQLSYEASALEAVVPRSVRASTGDDGERLTLPIQPGVVIAMSRDRLFIAANEATGLNSVTACAGFRLHVCVNFAAHFHSP